MSLSVIGSILAAVLPVLFEVFWSRPHDPNFAVESKTDADDDDLERRLLDRIHGVWP